MGIEVVDGVVVVVVVMGEVDLVEVFVGVCEMLDLGDRGIGEVWFEVDSNGCLMENEGVLIEVVFEVGGDLLDIFCLFVKNWSDFNVVCVKMFGD